MASRRLVWILLALAVAASAGAAVYALGPIRAAAAERGQSAPTVAPTGLAGVASDSTDAGSAPATAVPATARPTVTGPPDAPTAGPTAPPTARSIAPAGSAPAAGCPEGDRQREVEGSLAQLGDYGPVTVDGTQSPLDCTAIKKFQTRYGISPAQGRAGATTAGVARRIATSVTATERAKCAVGGSSLTICVDLTQQTSWAVRDGAVVWGPTVIRSGMAGFKTPTGTYRIVGRASREWSVPYKVWMPYWQAFNGGIGLHETTTNIHQTSIGSHGCVNLLHADAVALWNLTALGTTVTVFGNRPGT
jgi:lipoprotein-anchoring transpeptidase ErfK/SrfK